MTRWFQTRHGAYFFLLLGIALVGLFFVLEFSFPRAEQLETASGRVVWNQERRGEMYFTIDGQPGHFVLLAKHDADGRLRQAVRGATNAYPVKVKFNRAQGRPSAYVKGDVYTAYGIAVGGKEVTSLENVRGSYRRDNLIVLLFALLFGGAGGFRLYALRDR